MSKISDSRYSNHSLRATSASHMFPSGVTEKIIAEVTGHKSLVALRQYERTTEAQFKAVGESISHMKQFATTAVVEKPVTLLMTGNEIP